MRRLCYLLVLVGFVGSLYFGWASHRTGRMVILQDWKWPRPSPYPDAALVALNDGYAARLFSPAPPPPGPPFTQRLYSHWPEVRGTILIVRVTCAFLFLAGALPLALSALRRLRRRPDFPVLLPRDDARTPD